MKTKAFICIIAAGVLWGTSGLFVNALAPYGFSSLQMSAWRAAVSVIVLAVYMLIRDISLFKIRLSEIPFILGCGVGIFGTATAYYVSMQATTVSTAVVLMYTAPVLVMIFSVAFLGEKLTRLKAVSVLCMLIGCALVSGIIGGLKFDAFGIAMGFLAGISYASYNIFSKLEMRRGNRPITVTFYCFLVMLIITFFACDIGETVSLTLVAPAPILPLTVGLGVLTSVMPYLMYTTSLKFIPVGTASALAIIEPMSATLFGVFILGEGLSAPSLFGIVLILFAVFLLSRTEDGKNTKENKK